eukprot:2610514-Prymnesium_polylepis.1
MLVKAWEEATALRPKAPEPLVKKYGSLSTARWSKYRPEILAAMGLLGSALTFPTELLYTCLVPRARLPRPTSSAPSTWAFSTRRTFPTRTRSACTPTPIGPSAAPRPASSSSSLAPASTWRLAVNTASPCLRAWRSSWRSPISPSN